MKVSRAVIATTLAIPLLSACGSSKKQTTTATHATTSGAAASSKIDAAFIGRVNAVCARATVGAAPFPYPNFDPVHPDVKLLPKVGAFFAKRQATGDAVPKQLRALGAPATGQALWGQILTLATQDRQIADRQIKAAEAANVREFVATVNEITQVSNLLGQLAGQAGFTQSSPCRMIF